MSKFSLLLVFAISLAAQASAQLDTRLHPHKLSTDLLSAYWGRNLLTSEISVAYGYRVSPRWEATARVGYSGFNAFARPTNIPEDARTRDYLGAKGLCAGVMGQYFLGEEQSRRWFLGPEFNFTYTLYDERVEPNRTLDLRKLTASLIGGQRYTFGALEIDWFVGCGISFRNFGWDQGQGQSSSNAPDGGRGYSASINFGLVEEPSKGVAVPAGLRVGWRF